MNEEMTGTCYHCGKESPVEFGYYICDNCDKEDKIQCPMNIKGLCQAECADICEYSSRCISMVHEPKKKTFLNNEKEIRFLIDLLRGMPEASVVVAKEKEHFYDVFKRVFGISDLEKKFKKLIDVDSDWEKRFIERIEKLENDNKMLNRNQGQCFRKRGQFTKELSELKTELESIGRVDAKQDIQIDKLEGGEKSEDNVHGSCTGESVRTSSVITDSKPPNCPECHGYCWFILPGDED